MGISSRGLDFVVRQEGFASHAYRDVAGHITIGTGFTNGSRIAVEMFGPIRIGMTVTREQNDRVLAEAFAREYGPPVDRAMPAASQHETDAGCSYSFNCGPGAMSDSWVDLWRSGLKYEAGERLKVSRVTANGKGLKGLVNRRAAEAKLLTTGDYGSGAPAQEAASDYMAKLRDLGYPSVNAFQKHHPNLIDDGILGPATRAQIDRYIAARREGTGVAIGVGIAVFLAQYGPFIAVAAIALLVGIFAFRRREEVTHWIKNRLN